MTQVVDSPVSVSPSIPSSAELPDKPVLALTPRIGWLTVNRECNMRCAWCYAKGTGYKAADEMPLDLARKLAQSMVDSGVNKVILIGGEPTLWGPLFEFNRFARTIGLSTTIVTNGTRFAIDSFWSEYQQTPCDHTSLSIKAFDEVSYRCVTGKSNFEQTKRGIARALSLATSVNASVVFTGEDLSELVNLARFAKECGASSLTISPGTPVYVDGRVDEGSISHPRKFVDGFVASYPAIDALFEGRINLSVKLPLCMWPREFIVALMDKGQVYSTCQLQHRTGLLFDPTGNMISCNSLADFKLGSWGREFTDTPSLQQHLKSNRVMRFYDHLNTYASTKCVTCSMKNKCGGGCPLFFGAFQSDELIKGWDAPVLN